MKNEKLLRLLIGLVSVVMCACLVLAACDLGGEKKIETPETTQPQATDPTIDEVTEPVESQPAETEPVETEPQETEPEETEPQETEPEETEPEPTQSSGPSVNTGTGGGYDPGTSDPTEPDTATEPEIVVPAAGSEKNAYAEQIKETSGSFLTVSIPAGEGIYYRVKTPGTFLRVEDADVSLIYNETTYMPVEGVLEITLPADFSQVIPLVFRNGSQEAKSFTVQIWDALGSLTNPNVLTSVADIQTDLAEGDADGVYYSWTADQSGVLNMALESDAEADAVITVNGASVQLSDQGGQAQIPVSAGDVVTIQVLANENSEGIRPAAKIRLAGYVAVIVELTISEVPAEVETVTIPAGQNVIYRIRGVRGKTLKIADRDFRVIFDGTEYTADEAGVISVKIPAGSGAAELLIFNDAAAAKATVFTVGYSLGHELNPHILTALGELETTVPSDQNGYYYSYTASASGVVTFQVWIYPELENAKTDILLTNKTTGTTATLWTTDENGDAVDNYTVSVPVTAGDQVIIRVTVTDESGKNLDASLTISGELYGGEALPIQVVYPGFTAYVPAGETLYYAGYNMNGLIFSLTGNQVQVVHNEVTYTGTGEPLQFKIVSTIWNPAIFAITNTGSAAASYDVSLAYPLGHSENPDKLLLGTNVLTQEAGATDYYYTFTAPRAGSLILTFDGSQQWIYTVDNLTQGIYGDTQWSDSDPLVTEMTTQVNANDVIQVRVNTYDAANMFETPAGTVTFTVKYVSGPTLVTSLTQATNINLMPGEFGAFTGQFYDHVLYISGAKNLVVYYDGTAYHADAKGEINVPFPASDGSDTQPDLEFTVENIGTANILKSLMFSSMEQGSKENPAPLKYGPNVMTQTQNDGADYYYIFNVTANGRFTITFDADADWVYQLTNLTRNQTSGMQLSVNGRYTYTLTVKKGDVIELMVNTFDPKTGGSPEGTVEFTVSPA